MKKQVIRLTEGDLHRIIKESVNRILSEDVFNNNNMSMPVFEIENINNIELNNIEGDVAIFNASGNDGSEYQIYVTFHTNEGQGNIPSYDYDVPDDYDGDTIDIVKVEITKWNDMNEEEDIPYTKDFEFEQSLSNEIENHLHSNGMINNHF
jgi:hypothetical protein